MNTALLPHERLSPQVHAALMDAARRRAVELRREAVHDFASGIARGLHALWHALRRRVAASRTMGA